MNESMLIDRKIIIGKIVDKVVDMYTALLPLGTSDKIILGNAEYLVKVLHGDNKALANMLHTDNKITRKIFEEITGYKIGKHFTLTVLRNSQGSLLEDIIYKEQNKKIKI